jgi:hypothetical protein
MRLLYKYFSNLLLLSILTILGGCGLIAEKNSALEDFRRLNRQRLAKEIRIGMSEEEVRELMKGYTATAELMGPRIVCSNPHRSETRNLGEDSALVLWYYTDLKKNDGVISDDELTPIVLQHNSVIGWGTAFLNNL